jgi:hypothetical protein
MIRRLSVTLLWGVAWPLSAAAQQKVALTRPEAEFAEPFTQVSGVRELPGGRVLVSDIRDKIVQLVDFATGTATPVGREGQGPEEYLLPSGLYPLPDGGALLQDFGNRRFLTIGPDGKIGKAVSPPQPQAPTEGTARGGTFMVGALIDARAADGRGNLYFQGMALPGGPNAGPVDSIPIMRWDQAQSIDTTAWVQVTEAMRPQVTRTGNAMSIRIGGNRAWSRQVQWGVAADGRIALVEPEPYRVTWIQGRGRTVGPAVAATPIKVTEADKKEYREQMARSQPIMMAFGGPGGRTAAPPPGASASREDPEWPDTKPAFSGRQAVLVTPEGEVYVERLRKAGDRVPVYDVFDGAGRLARQITLRPRSRVVGFGRGTVYVTRSDEDDLQYLERYRRP